jgi:very-short-patch-repair endonuclease
MPNNPTRELLGQFKLVAIDDPTLELKFHPERKWRLDMAWESEKLAVEVHGGVYVNGRHTRGKGFTTDREKMNEAQLLGWMVLEVTTEHVKKGQALQWIEKALKQRGL